MAAAGAAPTKPHEHAVGSPTLTGSVAWLPKALIQQVADGTEVILLSRVPGKAISPDDSASNASVDYHQSFS